LSGGRVTRPPLICRPAVHRHQPNCCGREAGAPVDGSSTRSTARRTSLSASPPLRCGLR